MLLNCHFYRETISKNTGCICECEKKKFEKNTTRATARFVNRQIQTCLDELLQTCIYSFLHVFWLFGFLPPVSDRLKPDDVCDITSHCVCVGFSHPLFLLLPGDVAPLDLPVAEEVTEVAEDGQDAVAHVGEHCHQHGRLLKRLDEGPAVQAAMM